jgi:hypothetical protein
MDKQWLHILFVSVVTVKFIKIFVTQQEKVVMATLNCCMTSMKVLHNKLRATPVFTSSLLVELRRREI